MIDWTSRAGGLATQLAAAGHLPDDCWRRAFEQTPRHVFVPEFFADHNGTLISGDDPRQREEWLAAVYTDDTLVTQLNRVPGVEPMWATSSSTMPSLMADMLHSLEVRDGHTVLEIGTGTGYNAALLAHRLGADRVTSIDINGDLVALARERLAGLGHAVHLVAGNGEHGVPQRAPYDRIIATCAVPQVPPAWVAQLAPDGLIVVDLGGELVRSLTVLRKTGPGTVTGRFSTKPGNFMWLRAHADNPLREGVSYSMVIDLDGAQDRTGAAEPIDLLMDNEDVRFLAQLVEPTLMFPSRGEWEGVPAVSLHAWDASWVKARPRNGQALITEGGLRRIWQAVEHTVALWERLGQPSRERFGITADTTGSIRYWLDEPANTIELAQTS